ncbi:cation transporter [Roseomonas sp. WA12]
MDGTRNGSQGQSVPWRVEGTDCVSCVAKVEKAVGRMPGVADLLVNLMAERDRCTGCRGERRCVLRRATPENASSPTAWVPDRRKCPLISFPIGRSLPTQRTRAKVASATDMVRP